MGASTFLQHAGVPCSDKKFVQLRADEKEGVEVAEFLLTHMRAVGFQEWIVVLATLLQRVEVRSTCLVQGLLILLRTRWVENILQEFQTQSGIIM